MSYCRFSDLDFSCQVYCYHSVSDVYVINVATSKIVGDIPKSDHLWGDPEKIDEYMEAHKKQMNFLKTADREPIGLAYDGDTFELGSAGEAADHLKGLQEAGYIVPDHAIDALYEEAREDLEPKE